MKYPDGRGKHWKKKIEKKIDLIKKYFDQNPDKSIKDCSDELNIPYSSINTYMKIIKNEETL